MIVCCRSQLSLPAVVKGTLSADLLRRYVHDLVSMNFSHSQVIDRAWQADVGTRVRDMSII
jgi:hypothetical protein